MTREDSARLAVRWIDAWIGLDIDWLRRKLAPDFVYVRPYGRLEGRESYLAEVLLPRDQETLNG